MLPGFAAALEIELEGEKKMSEDKSVRLSFACAGGDFERAGEASAKIKKMLRQIGVPPDCVRRIAIGTYEAEMNVIIHANGGTVQAEVFPDRTMITVTDEGPGIPDIKKALQKGYSTAPEHIRHMGFGAGMGLPNMQMCSDSLDIRSVVGEGTTIVMKFLHQVEDL